MYKIPSADCVPRDWSVHLVGASERTPAVHSSRGIGEPPLMLGSSAMFAMRAAVMARRAALGLDAHYALDAPTTSERLRLACEDDIVRRACLGAERVPVRGSW